MICSKSRHANNRTSSRFYLRWHASCRRQFAQTTRPPPPTSEHKSEMHLRDIEQFCSSQIETNVNAIRINVSRGRFVQYFIILSNIIVAPIIILPMVILYFPLPGRPRFSKVHFAAFREYNFLST